MTVNASAPRAPKSRYVRAPRSPTWRTRPSTTAKRPDAIRSAAPSVADRTGPRHRPRPRARAEASSRRNAGRQSRSASFASAKARPAAMRPPAKSSSPPTWMSARSRPQRSGSPRGMTVRRAPRRASSQTCPSPARADASGQRRESRITRAPDARRISPRGPTPSRTSRRAGPARHAAAPVRPAAWAGAIPSTTIMSATVSATRSRRSANPAVPIIGPPGPSCPGTAPCPPGAVGLKRGGCYGNRGCLRSSAGQSTGFLNRLNWASHRETARRIRSKSGKASGTGAAAFGALPIPSQARAARLRPSGRCRD